MKTLYTGGTFDLFHSGHARFLKNCSSLADRVVVALNTDEFVQRYKKTTPLMTFEQRKEVLLSCRYVSQVVENTNGEDSKPAIVRVNPDIIAIGDDWCRKDYYKQMNFTQEWLDKRDILLVYIPYTQGISTTLLKSKINQ